MVALCLLTITMAFVSVVVRLITHELLIERMGINNKFTHLIFNEFEHWPIEKRIDINWAEIYPFMDKTGSDDNNIKKVESDSDTEKSVITTTFDDYKEKVNGITSSINVYVNKRLVGYYKILDLLREFESWINWHFVVYDDGEYPIQLSDGYLTFTGKKIPNDKLLSNAQSIINFRQFLDSVGCKLLYVQVPFKTCKILDTDICGIEDFSNENADCVIQNLEYNKINVLDLRKEIHKDGLNHHSLFFKNDHHWTPSAGLWAVGKVFRYCNDNDLLSADVSNVMNDNFRIDVIPEFYFGSQAKRAIDVDILPDDFEVFYPIFETKFHYEIPTFGIDTIGDFSVMYNKRWLVENEVYESVAYGAYNHAEHPLIKTKNLLSENDSKVLLISESFVNVFSPFASLCVSELHSIDLRQFNGSLKTYIREYRPDIVIFLYNPGVYSQNVFFNLQ